MLINFLILHHVALCREAMKFLSHPHGEIFIMRKNEIYLIFNFADGLECWMTIGFIYFYLLNNFRTLIKNFILKIEEKMLWKYPEICSIFTRKKFTPLKSSHLHPLATLFHPLHALIKTILYGKKWKEKKNNDLKTLINVVY